MATQKPSSDLSFEPTFAHVAVLGVTCSLGPFATNGIVPAFHAISETFGMSLADMQQMLTVYLVALAIGSLLVGSLSDAFGRKRVLAAGMLLFSVSSVGALYSDSLATMNVWRFLQGLGACTGQVITQAMVRDRWSGLSAARAMSIIGMLFSVAPAVAPIVGGWLVVRMGWQASFWFLMAYSLSIWAITVFVLKETLPREKRLHFDLRALLLSYGTCLKNPAYTAGIISNGCSFMGMILVVAGGADFVVNVMGFGVDGFAWLSVPLVVASVAGSFLAPPLALRLGTRNLVVGAGVLLILFEFTMTYCMHEARPGYLETLLIGFVFNFVGNLVRPVVMAMNLDYHPRCRGLSASIQQGFHTLGFALSSAVLAPLCIGQAWKYALAMGVCAVLALLFWMIALHYRKAYLPA